MGTFCLLRMKVLKLFLIILLVLAKNASANDLKFRWNIGNIKMSYDIINDIPIFDAELLHFSWIYNNFSFGFNALKYYDIDNEEKNVFSILPLSTAFVPINFKDTVFFSIYANGGLRLTQFNNNNQFDKEFYGAIGTKLFIFPKLLYNYSPYFSLYTEYSTRNELRIGLGMDLSFIFYIALLAIKEDTERKYDKTSDWTRR